MELAVDARHRLPLWDPLIEPSASGVEGYCHHYFRQRDVKTDGGKMRVSSIVRSRGSR